MKKTFMGVRLRRLREERGMTQVALARALDLSASYSFMGGYKLSFDAFNLTNAVREEYESSVLKPRRLDVDGRTYQVKLSAAF